MNVVAPLLFSLGSSRMLGEDVAVRLGVQLAPHEEREFDGGEHKSRPLVGVRGRDVYVLASLDGDDDASANDKLCRLLFLIGALRQAGAGTVTAVCPYLCYSRKDRQTKARDPVTTRYVAQMFEAVGTDRLVTLDVHNLAAFQNASRNATEHLEATQLFVDHIVAATGGSAGADELVVVSPDIGGVKRAGRLRDRLAAVLGRPVELAFTEKFRSSGVVSGRDEVLGDVEGRTAIVIDDLISSGGTMARVAAALRSQGAASVTLCATHGLFTPAAARLFASDAVDAVVVTDSVRPRTGLTVGGRVPLVVLPVGGLLAEAIDRMHRGGSLSELLHLD
ncbi:MAG: ribose-phosphate pyrophosphokinase [Acidimicrobiales bacterium]|nr:ribose-phosphate pyrophosphokinase [Acidimicrobiales bacterium]